jgi:hypothetical protein
MFDSPNTDLNSPAGEPAAQAEELDGALFSREEMARLRAARDRHQHGELQEWLGDYKRLRFARWLYEHGDLTG